MSAKIKIVLKKLKGTDHVYHRESGIILRSSDVRTAIGRYENDTPIYSLTNEYIEKCKKLRFQYDESLLEEDDDQEEDEEQDENEEEDAEQVDESPETEQVDESPTELEEVNKSIDDPIDDPVDPVDDPDDPIDDPIDDPVDVPVDDPVDDTVVETGNQIENTKVIVNVDNIKTSYVRNITSEFSNKLCSTFDLLHVTYSQKISDYENKLVDCDNKFNKLQLEYNKTKTELENLKVKFQKLKLVLE